MRAGGVIRNRIVIIVGIVALASSACGSPDLGSKGASSVERPQVDTTTTLDGQPDEQQSAFEPEGLYGLSYRAFDPLRWLASTGFVSGTAATTPRELAEVGDTEEFWVSRGLEIESVTATLAYANEGATFWVEDGMPVSDRDLRRAADAFTDGVLPKVTDVFGQMPDPGIDGDPRLAVLHVETLSGAAGEFVSYDLLPAVEFDRSNEREMIYMGLDGFVVGSDAYLATLAHELQHLLDFHLSKNTPLWMAEGMAQVAERIAGFDQVVADDDYLSNLSIPLNDWNILQLDDRHYGGSYLFLTYLYERFGAESMVALIESRYSGMAAVAELARAHGTDLSTLVGDWVAAIALDDPTVGDGSFVFLSDDLGRACPVTRPDATPYRHNQSVRQFAPRYYAIDGAGDITLTFNGAEEIGVIPDLAFRGEHLWWAGRADSSLSSMTRSFDLSGVSAASLEFRTWFDTGFDDGGMVQVSVDEGSTWTVMEGRRTESIGASVGEVIPAYTGTSGSSTEAAWIRDEIDLSDFVGQSNVLIRFEYATDLFEGRIGWAVDNIEIAALGYFDGGEAGSDWELDGFIHTNNRFEQPWTVRIIQPGSDQPVTEVPLTAGRGTTTIDGDGGPATVAIVATAPGVGTGAEFTVEVDGALNLSAPEALAGEDFSVPCSGWEAEETDSYALTLDDDGLTVTVRDTETFTWSAKDGYHEDVTIAATAVFGNDEDTLAGLMCRLNSDGFYDFEISSDGFFYAGVAHPGGYDTLQDWAPSPAIDIGAGGTNEIELSCIGTELQFTINGTTVLTLSDDRVRAGQVALAAGSFDTLDDDAVVSFSPVTIVGVPIAEMGSVLYSEDFENGRGEWSAFATARGTVSEEDGAYRLDVRGSDWSVDGYLEGAYDDVVIDAAVRFNEFPPDSIAGVACRTDQNLQQYLFLVSADGYFTVMAYHDDEFHDIVPWDTLISIDTQPGAVNHLHVECVGSRLLFEVNGLVVADTTDGRLDSGEVGFVGFTFERGGLSFDVLEIVLRDGG